MNNSKNRYISELPKVGIRPVIDARKEVRVQEKDSTINMAQRVANFITEDLKHPCGKEVECVVPDRCIGGFKEARQIDEYLFQNGAKTFLTVSSVWAYGKETMLTLDNFPCAVWALNSPSRPGAVYLSALKSAHAQKGHPLFTLYGSNVKNQPRISEDIKYKLTKFIKAGLTLNRIKNKSYLSIGSVSMGIADSNIQNKIFQDYLGMKVESIDMIELYRRLKKEIYDKDEFERAFNWTKENFNLEKSDPSGNNFYSSEQMSEVIARGIKLTLIIRNLMTGDDKLREKGYKEESLGHNSILAGFQGQREWTDYEITGDFTETILNSSFDWNGPRQPYLLATENDSLTGLSMLINHQLSNRAQIFADMRTFWSPESVGKAADYQLQGRAKNGLIHLKNSGSAALDGSGKQKNSEGENTIKPFWRLEKEDIARCLEAVNWYPANEEYFPAGGISVSYTTSGGIPLTLSKINYIRGLGPVIQIIEGYSVFLPEKVEETLDNMTDPTWPSTWFVPKPESDVTSYQVMNEWGANHAAVSYGHIADRVVTTAAMLRIPVAFHNLTREQIFRPSVWSAFGTKDWESADFRACDNFGPRYKS